MRLLISFLMVISELYSADFTTYVGVTNQEPPQQSTAAIATDAAGDTYVTGAGGASSEAFVTKLGPAGNIVFSIAVGGQCCALSTAIAVDPAGNIWAAGITSAPNFPLVNALQSSPGTGPSGAGVQGAFLVKMTPDGTIVYSSYFGGVKGSTEVYGIATDKNGNVYVTGETTSSDFPRTAGLPASPVSAGADLVFGGFVTKLDATGQKIIYSTVISGPVLGCPDNCEPYSYTEGLGIVVDGAGNALVAGNTNTNLPVTSGSTSSSGAFALKINASGNALVYLIDIGPTAAVINAVGTSSSVGNRPIAVDASGNAYLAGFSNSPKFPTTPGAYQTSYTGGVNPEAFAMKLNPNGATIWATFLGGGLTGNRANAVSVDSSDNVWLTGDDGIPTAPGESFVAELSADGSALPYSEQFPQGEAGQDIAIDPSGEVHFAGAADLISTISPASLSAPRANSILNAASGTTIGLVAPGEIISIFGSGIGPTNPVAATPQNGVFPKSLGGVQVLVNGTPVPLLYVSASQINAEIPSPIHDLENEIAVLQVVNNSVALPDFRVAVAASEFGVFHKPRSQSLAAVNQDGTLNSIENPAKAGSYVSIFATGFGSAAGVVLDGSVATSADNYCADCQVTILGYGSKIPDTVQYLGPSPGLIDGLVQINFLIPAQLNLTNIAAPAVQVYFTPLGYAQPIFLGFVQVSQ
jgi:uncharacterized protein (TIGR03437 family)